MNRRRKPEKKIVEKEPEKIPIVKVLLADIASEKTGVHHLSGILEDAERAYRRNEFLEAMFPEADYEKVKRAIEAKRKVLEEAKQLAIKQDRKKQKSLF